MGKDLKNLSRVDFDADDSSLESINTSCLMRIADAVELMAKNYLQMQSDLDYLRKRNRHQQDQIQGRDNTIRTLRGHVTRLKRKTDK